MIILAFFYDKGTPKSGLTPTINIIDVDLDELIIEEEVMVELTTMPHAYKYDFSLAEKDKNYAILIDGGSSLDNADRYLSGTSDPANVKDLILGENWNGYGL